MKLEGKNINACLCFDKRNRGQCKWSSLLFAVDTALIADSDERLQSMMNEKMGVGGGRRQLNGDVKRSNIMEVSKSGECEAFNVRMNKERMKES